jgi:hypothetical protein
MKRAAPLARSGRSAFFRLAAMLLLIAEAVAVGLSPIAEASESPDFPTHIEATGTPPHAGHHPGICAFCVHRHLSPLPARRSAAVPHIVQAQTLRPETQLAAVVTRYDRPDPARAPPPPPPQSLTTL